MSQFCEHELVHTLWHQSLDPFLYNWFCIDFWTIWTYSFFLSFPVLLFGKCFWIFPPSRFSTCFCVVNGLNFQAVRSSYCSIVIQMIPDRKTTLLNWRKKKLSKSKLYFAKHKLGQFHTERGTFFSHFFNAFSEISFFIERKSPSPYFQYSVVQLKRVSISLDSKNFPVTLLAKKPLYKKCNFWRIAKSLVLILL